MTDFSDIKRYCPSAFVNGLSTIITKLTDNNNFICNFIPLVFLLVFGAENFISTLRKPPDHKLRRSLLFNCKLTFGFLGFFSCLIDLIFFLVQKKKEPQVSLYKIFSPVILAFTFLVFLVYCFVEHSHGKGHSHVLTVFWIVAGIFYFPELYYNLDPSNDLKSTLFVYAHKYVYIVFYTIVFFSLLLSLFSEPIKADQKSERANRPTSKLCPELYSSFLSRITFSWMDKLIFAGWKGKLSYEKLWYLDKKNTVEYINDEFQKHWNDQLKKRKPSIIIALVKSFGRSFLIAGFFKIMNDLLLFVSPQILKLMICFIKNKEISTSFGWIITVALLLLALTQTLILHQYFHRCFVTGMRARTAIVSAVYQKSLTISSEARSKYQHGEMVNLISVDAQRLMDILPFLHLLWSSPLQIILSVYFLFEVMEKASLVGLGVMLIIIPLNGLIAYFLRKLSSKLMKIKDTRMKIVNEVLNGIRVLKLYAWENSFLSTLMRTRKEELRMLRKIQNFNALTSFFWISAPFLVSLATFATYSALLKKELTAERAFVSLSLFNIMRFPLSMFPSLVSSLIEASVSFKRLRKFLLAGDIDKNNVNRQSPVEGKEVYIRAKGDFSWGYGQPPTLKNINIESARGKLIAIVGPVGCGKSTLCSALIGEVFKENGEVSICGDVAYVSQHPWIQNTTLKKNILFGSQYNHELYAKTLRACALLPDLEVLPAGDETEIGEKGINLSGGQKQRISIARAVYQQCNIYIFDDPLSAVDAHVGKHIFNEVLGPKGLLRNDIRILVTHKIDILNMCDYIYTMLNGEIKEEGTFETLKKKGGVFSAFIAEHMKESDEQSNEQSFTNVREGVVETTEKNIRKLSKTSLKSMKSIEAGELPNAQQRKGILVVEENVEQGDIKLAVFVIYCRAIGWITILLVISIFFIGQGFQIYTNIWLSRWSSAGANASKDISYWLGVYTALGLAYSLSNMLTSFSLAFGSIHASKNLHETVVKRLLKAPLSFFDTTLLGRIVNRLSKDIYTIDEALPNSLKSFLNTFFSVLGTIFIIAFATPKFLIIVLPLLLLYIVIQRFYVSSSRQLKRLESVSRSPIFAHFQETNHGVSTIRAYGREERFIKENIAVLEYNQRSYYPSISSNRWLAIRLESIGNMVVFFASLFAVVSRNSISSALVGLSLSHAMNITQSLNWMVRMSSECETNIVAVERIDEYTKIPQEREEEKDDLEGISSDTDKVTLATLSSTDTWPSHGVVEFKNYSARYREGLKLVLDNISFIIKSGEKVGVVGRTGAGKSSLTLSLFRIIEPFSGCIEIDGVNIQNVSLFTLRSSLSIIPQDPVIFFGTVRSNLDPFSLYTDSQIWAALEYCHLKNFVKGLDKQLDHEILEGGSNFSVGQRQLICLGRALLRKTKILILDEATAAVDLDTDKLIQETIRSEFRSCTILTIAHRINTILDNDKVLVLENGRVKEFDSPSVLLNEPSSLFYGLAKESNLVS